MALSQALHDVEHEISGLNLVHYWDDDSLYLPVRGLLALTEGGAAGRNRAVVPDKRDRLVHSLFSAGFLGHVALLPPHRGELLAQISRWSRERIDKSRLHSEIAGLLGSQPSRALLEIAESLSGQEEVPRPQAEALIHRLAALSSEAFVLVDATVGSWPARLERLLRDRLLRNDPLAVPDDTYSDELFNEIAGDINHFRGGNRTVSTAIDAAALATLVAYVERARRGDRTGFPRFYTSSPQLKKYFHSSPRLQQRLSFPVVADGSTHLESAWRDADYYYLRAVHPALRIGTPMSSEATEEIAELRDLSIELSRVLSRGSASEVVRLVETYPLGGDRTLADAMQEFEDLHMATLWLNYDRDLELPRSLERLSNLQRVGATTLVREIARELELGSLRRLRSELFERELSIRMLDAVHRASSAHERYHGTGRLSLREDLGSIRWGLDFSGPSDIVTLRPGGAGNYAELVRMYDVEFLNRNPSALTRALAVLLGLDQFELARLLVEHTVTEAASYELALMSLVAAVSAPGYRSEIEIAVWLSTARSWWEEIPPAERGRFALGYGYILFVLWGFSVNEGAWPTSGAGSRDLAVESMSVVQEYLDVALESSDIEWANDLWIAYAVNHMVYVGFSASLVDNRLVEMSIELERVAERMENYRFLDTVGCALLWRARHIDAGDEASRELRMSFADRAYEHLDHAVRLQQTDRDLQRHRDEANAYRQGLRAQ